MNSFFGIGLPELFFIAILALIVLGPERLPGALRQMAEYFRQIRDLTQEVTSQFSEELQALDDINPAKIMNEVTQPVKDMQPKNIIKNLEKSTKDIQPKNIVKQLKESVGDKSNTPTDKVRKPQRTPKRTTSSTSNSTSERKSQPKSVESELENQIMPPESAKKDSTSVESIEPAEDAPSSANSSSPSENRPIEQIEEVA